MAVRRLVLPELTVLVLAVGISVRTGAAPAAAEVAQMRALRRQAAWRQRRLVFNNDGDDHLLKGAVSVKAFLAKRSTPLIGSQVDTVVYCTSRPFGMFTHNTQVGDVFRTVEGFSAGRNIVPELIEQGTDPLACMSEFCRSNGLEIIWSMRMNDTHDAGHSPSRPHYYFSSFKREHPECLIGSLDSRPLLGAWNAVNYARQEVCNFAFRVFEEIASGYDIDGIELDFFRHLIFFRSVALGGEASDEEREMMTGLVRRTRTMLDQVGRERGKPLLLTVRTPDSAGYCHAIGLNLERWLAEGLVDVLVAGGDFRLNPRAVAVDLGHRHGVPVWCDHDINVRYQQAGAFNRNSIETLRARASESWQSGADALYFFNWFNPRHAMWRELGDPEGLRTLPKTYFANVMGQSGWRTAEIALRGGLRFLTLTRPHAGSPVRLADGRPLVVPLTLGREFDGPEAPSATGHVLAGAGELRIAVNGQSLAALVRSDGWRWFSVPAGILRAGTNELTLSCPPEAATVGDRWDVDIPATVLLRPGHGVPWSINGSSPRTVREVQGEVLLIADRGNERGDYTYLAHNWQAAPDVEAVAELTVKVVSGRNGIIVANGVREEMLWLEPGRVFAERAQLSADIDLSDDFHTCRITVCGENLRVEIDGKLLLRADGLYTRTAAGGRNTLCFGAATSPMLGEALWRHVRLRAGKPGCRVYDVVLSTRPTDAEPPRKAIDLGAPQRQ